MVSQLLLCLIIISTYQTTKYQYEKRVLGYFFSLTCWLSVCRKNEGKSLLIHRFSLLHVYSFYLEKKMLVWVLCWHTAVNLHRRSGNMVSFHHKCLKIFPPNSFMLLHLPYSLYSYSSCASYLPLISVLAIATTLGQSCHQLFVQHPYPKWIETKLGT